MQTIFLKEEECYCPLDKFYANVLQNVKKMAIGQIDGYELKKGSQDGVIGTMPIPLQVLLTWE